VHDLVSVLSITLFESYNLFAARTIHYKKHYITKYINICKLCK